MEELKGIETPPMQRALERYRGFVEKLLSAKGIEEGMPQVADIGFTAYSEKYDRPSLRAVLGPGNPLSFIFSKDQAVIITDQGSILFEMVENGKVWKTQRNIADEFLREGGVKKPRRIEGNQITIDMIDGLSQTYMINNTPASTTAITVNT